MGLIQTDERLATKAKPLDARSMNSRGTGLVGYNMQSAVDSRHHLIVTHAVSNVGSDRSQLSGLAKGAKAILGSAAQRRKSDRTGNRAVLKP